MALSMAALQQGVRPVTPPNPINRMKAIAEAQAMQQQSQLRGLQIRGAEGELQAQQKAQQDALAVNDILTQSKGEVTPEVIAAIRPINSQFASALEKAELDRRNTESQIKDRESSREAQVTRDALAEQDRRLRLAQDENKAYEERNKPIEVSPGASLWNRIQGKFVGTAPSTQKPEARSNLHPDTMTVNGKPEDVLVGVDPSDAATFQKVFLRGQDVTDKSSHYEKPAAVVNVGQLTDAGLDAAATAFAKTGQLPALGNRDQTATLKTKIINRAAELNPNLDTVANKADIDANRASLTQATKLKDALTSFENTALKNMGILESSAKKILDSGSPLLNRPLRTIDEKLLGNTELPVYRAARQIVVNEVAKLTNNPNLTGQLSDTARHEIESLLPAEMTLAQLMKLLPTLRQDMKNRTSSIDEQISAIRKRIGGTSSTPSGFVVPGGALEKLIQGVK